MVTFSEVTLELKQVLGRSNQFYPHSNIDDIAGYETISGAPFLMIKNLDCGQLSNRKRVIKHLQLGHINSRHSFVRIIEVSDHFNEQICLFLQVLDRLLTNERVSVQLSKQFDFFCKKQAIKLKNCYKQMIDLVFLSRRYENYVCKPR